MPEVIIDKGDNGYGTRWAVRKRDGIMALTVGNLTVLFTPEAAEQLAEAVARAVTPGQMHARVYPCCKCCERDNAENGSDCQPHGHLSKCENGCDDAPAERRAEASEADSE
jgi:hypothetical protein